MNREAWCGLRRCAAVLALAACTATPAAAPSDRARAADAEHLATLAERIARLDLQLAQGILAARARRALQESVREFDALLPQVGALARDGEARDNFVLLGILWRQMRAWAAKPSTRDNARQVCDRAEEVGWIASKGARLLGAPAASPRALEALAAATLAQRIARLHLMLRLNPRDEAHAADLARASARLDAALAGFRGSANSPEVASELAMALSQQEFLTQAVHDLHAGGGAGAMEVIVKTADHIADAMQRAARLLDATG